MLIELENISKLERNWDGYNANPIRSECIQQASQFIDMLPADIPSPTIRPSHDGELILRWGENINTRLYIAIRGDDRYYGFFICHSDRVKFYQKKFSDSQNLNKIIECIYKLI